MNGGDNQGTEGACICMYFGDIITETVRDLSTRPPALKS